jgi:AbrB family looped-hinge helix DNA binding protein
MATRITAKGQVILPRRVREALGLAAGDRVVFGLNGHGEVILRKAPAVPPSADRQPREGRPAHQRAEEAQMRRRAAELLALLRGLD